VEACSSRNRLCRSWTDLFQKLRTYPLPSPPARQDSVRGLQGGFLDDNDSLVPNTLGSLKLEMCFRTDWRLLLKLKYMSFSIKEQL
jgi:hypothetical protein